MISPRDMFESLPDDGYGLIDGEELQIRLEDSRPPYILDIRRSADWQVDHIPGSVHSEWEEVGSLIDENTLPKDRDIVVVCYVGQSSGQTTGMLRALGYSAYSLLNGYSEWKGSGRRVESQAKLEG